MITPFRAATLEIGGSIETYWKSLTAPFSSAPTFPSRMAQPFRSLGPPLTSPSSYTLTGSTNSNSQTITLSSLTGDYIHLTVQVTRDLNPILYDSWKLAVAEFDLGVSDVSLSQVQGLAARAGLVRDLGQFQTLTPTAWQKLLQGSMMSLMDILKVR